MREQFDSYGEQYFADWLIELQAQGYIKSWERITTPLSLTEGLTHKWVETVPLKTKTKTVTKSQVLLRASEYTPDFSIVWSKHSINIFFQPLNHSSKITCPFLARGINDDYISIVEIKPSWDYKNMTRGFINNQKFVWEKYGEFINLIVVDELFKDTFAPQTYFKTPTGLERKFSKGKPLNLAEWHDKI